MVKRAAIVFLLLGMAFLLLSGTLYAQEQPPTQPEGGETTPGAEPPTPGNVYFYLDGELAPAQRDITGGGQGAEFAVIELLKGPTEEEKTAGYETFIPEGVKMQYSTVKQDRSEYSVNLSRELLELSGDKDAAAKALAQIEKTLQEVTGIQIIGITVAGEGSAQPEDAYALLGVAHETPQGTDSEGGGGGGNTTVLIIAIVASLAVIVILLFFIFYIPNRRAKAPVQSETPPENTKKSAK